MSELIWHNDPRRPSGTRAHPWLRPPQAFEYTRKVSNRRDGAASQATPVDAWTGGRVGMKSLGNRWSQVGVRACLRPPSMTYNRLCDTVVHCDRQNDKTFAVMLMPACTRDLRKYCVRVTLPLKSNEGCHVVQFRDPQSLSNFWGSHNNHKVSEASY